MKKFIISLIVLFIFGCFGNALAIDSSNKSKNNFIKEVITSKHELEKTVKGKKYKKQIDNIIKKLSDEKLIKIYFKLDKINLNSYKLKKHKNILIYLKSSIGIKLYNNIKEMTTYNEGDIVAVMKTTNGTIKILMETEKVPRTTTNFIGLAKQGYYDGVIFHRIIKGFMIQGGDPDGTGMGGTSIYGEKFDDEFHVDLKNNPYTISMANAGPNTNGSQFFINTAANNFLDNKHSVFGRVVEGFDAVDKLEKVKTGANDRPVKEVKMIKVEIKEFKGGSLKDYEFSVEEKLKEIEDEKKAKLEDKKTSKLKKGDIAVVDYVGTLEDGTKFDSSIDRGQPLEFEVGAGKMIKGFDAGVVGMKIGDKKKLTLAPSDAYGERDDTKRQVVPKADLQSFIDAGFKLTVGTKLPTQMGELEIIDLTDENVVLDINHPMSGKTLIFDIEIIDIK